MPTTPRLTIGIAFRNPGKHFELALTSVFSQTFTDWELLLIDDGSDDDSLILARGVRDVRVSVIADGLQLGLPARLNQIALLARGECLARMDADDLMHPDRLRRHPPLLNRGILACALSLWRREDLRSAVAIFESIPVAAHEDPAVAWFYGTVLAAHGEFAKASRYLALGVAARRCPEEELLFREARQRVQGQGRSR